MWCNGSLGPSHTVRIQLQNVLDLISFHLWAKSDVVVGGGTHFVPDQLLWYFVHTFHVCITLFLSTYVFLKMTMEHHGATTSIPQMHQIQQLLTKKCFTFVS
jgi:hypothetical protein